MVREGPLHLVDLHLSYTQRPGEHKGGPMPDDVAADAILPTIRTGTYRQQLEALRNRLAAGIDGVSSRQLIHLAPLAKQLAEVMRLLEELPDEGAPADAVEQTQASVERLLRSVQ